jgi:F-type H+-transporting ATPase subunit b
MQPVFLDISALGFNLPALVAQLINFTLLLIVFRVLLYRPLLNMLDQRKQRIEEGLQASDEAKKRLAETEQETAKELDKARKEGQALILQAQEAANRLREEEIQRARLESERLIERARQEITLERDAAIAELRREFAGLAVVAAEKVIKKEIDDTTHRKLIEEVLEEASVGGGGAA